MKAWFILILLGVIGLVIACGWGISCFQRDVYCLSVSADYVVEYVANGGTIAVSFGTDGDPFRTEIWDHVSYERSDSGWLGRFGFGRSALRTELQTPFWLPLLMVGAAGFLVFRRLE